MKRLIVTFLVSLVVLFTYGCSLGNYPSVVLSAITSDGTGGAYIAYRVDRSMGDQDVHLRRIGWPNGQTLWDVEMFTGDDRRTGIGGLVPDTGGNAIVAWNVLAPSDGKEGLHHFDHATVAKVDDEGKIQWQTKISHEIGSDSVIAAGSDSLIITSKFYRLDANGNLLWEKDNETELALKAVDGGEGSTLLRWASRENPYFVVQKLNARGEPQWQEAGFPEGIRVRSIGLPGDQEPQIVSDGSGGAIVSSADLTGQGQPNYVHVLRIGVGGKVLWNAPVRENLTSTIHPRTRLVSDGSGGATVFWEDHRQEMAIYAQKVSPEGKILWQANGLRVAADMPRQSPLFDAVSDGSGGAVLAWKTGDGKIYTQHIDATGNKKWGETGILVASGAAGLPIKLIKTNDGGVIVSWQTGNPDRPKDAFLQKIDSTGKILWGEKGIRLNL